METIEELKQSNAKLTERLNNAAKFFREQKAQIEALTKENEELKDQINRAPQEEVIDTEKWNKLVTEKENLNKQCNEYELKLQKLESDIDSKDKAHNVLQNTYNELFGENAKLKKDSENRINQLKKDYKELKESANKIIDSYEKDLNTYKEKEIELTNKLEAEVNNNAANKTALDNVHKEFEKVNTELKEVKANREEFRSQLVDLEKQYDQLNKLYEDCESEKLSALSDYKQLQEKIKYIEANNISDKEWQDHLENVIEQIRNLADDVINPKSATNKIKENVMKRTGDYNVSGENIGI